MNIIKDTQIPAGLSRRGKHAANIILKQAAKRERFSTGGCRAFYTPKEWKDKGEPYGDGAVLIVCHDGGDFGPMFELDHMCYALVEEMMDALGAKGFHPEGMYCWCTAIYDDKN